MSTTEAVQQKREQIAQLEQDILRVQQATKDRLILDIDAKIQELTLLGYHYILTQSTADGKKVRLCQSCGKPGHNVRTCKRVPLNV